MDIINLVLVVIGGWTVGRWFGTLLWEAGVAIYYFISYHKGD